MLHTKFQGNRPIGSREDFFKGFTIYGHDCQLGHVTRPFKQTLDPPSHKGSICNLS